MTIEQIDQINSERLTRWAARLRENHATAVILIGVGHDQTTGQIQLITTEDPTMTNEVLAAFCQYAAFQLDRAG